MVYGCTIIRNIWACYWSLSARRLLLVNRMVSGNLVTSPFQEFNSFAALKLVEQESNAQNLFQLTVLN